MLRMLGPDGMSSDEPDEDTPGQYKIIQPSWRSSAVSRWAHVMDAAYERQKNPPGQSRSRGAPTRRRIPSDRIDDIARPVKGLPINMYDASWYSERSKFDRENIGATQEPYNLSHDNGLLQCVAISPLSQHANLTHSS